MPSPDQFPVWLIVRWLARIGSLASIGLLMAFVFGPHERIDRPLFASEAVMLAFFPIGIMLGMAVGWWNELIGGSLTVISLAAFYLAHYLIAGDLPGGPYFFYFASPGCLFLLAWCVERFSMAGKLSLGAK